MSPVYEYECSKCGRRAEVLQKVDDKAPECHGKMKKLISRSSFHLKGTGWYKTDYAEDKNAKRKRKETRKPRR